MTQLGSHLLFDFWQSILAPAGVNIRVTGVFCHQTPKAHFPFNGKTAMPELADLLIVHEHLSPTPRRRALLVQAKMAMAGQPCGTVDPVQKHLYDRWPDFKLHGYGASPRSKFLIGDRNLRSNVTGGRYGLIETAPAAFHLRRGLYPSVWRLAYPHSLGTVPARDAAIALTKMVLGKTGFGRPAEPLSLSQMRSPGNARAIARNRPRGHHWSTTVQELLDLTAAKSLSAKMQGPISSARGMIFQFCQHGTLPSAGGVGDRFTDGGDVAPKLLEEEPEGISILLIETSGERLSTSHD